MTRHADLSIGMCGLAVTRARAGRMDEARQARDCLVVFSAKTFVPRNQFAMIECALGNDGAALAERETAAAAHHYNVLCSAVDPTFDRLHRMPQSQALMRRCGLPDDQDDRPLMVLAVPSPLVRTRVVHLQPAGRSSAFRCRNLSTQMCCLRPEHVGNQGSTRALD